MKICYCLKYDQNQFMFSKVEKYQRHVSEHLTHQRVLKSFLEIVEGLENLRNRMIDMTKVSDVELERIYSRWSQVLSRRMVGVNELSELDVAYC